MLFGNSLAANLPLRRTPVKCSVIFALVLTSIAASEQPATNSVFDPERDCDPMPALIRDAAKDAGIAIKVVCYISDRPKFAVKAGEPFATDLDRVGDMVRVVVPFGHLLLVKWNRARRPNDRSFL